MTDIIENAVIIKPEPVITRTIPSVRLRSWGLPDGDYERDCAQILDVVLVGNTAGWDYSDIVFRAPDDQLIYVVTLVQNRHDQNDYYFGTEALEDVVCTRVAPKTQVVTVTCWEPVKELPAPDLTVPTLDQLKDRWARNRAYDEAEADWAMEW